MFTFFLLLVGLAASFASPVSSDGLPATSSRTVVTRDAKIEEVPWQVSVQLNGRHRCAGSLISSFWIISSSALMNCMDRDASLFSVRVGSSVKNSGGTVHAVDFYIRSPELTPAGSPLNINLVKVIEPIEFSAQVQPVSLPVQSAKLDVGTLGNVTGWESPTGSNPPDNLQIGLIPYVPMERCRDFYGSADISHQMICVGYLGAEIDPIPGDFGAPFVVDGVLYGTRYSWGFGGVLHEWPTVYTDVAHFRNWIAQTSGV